MDRRCSGSVIGGTWLLSGAMLGLETALVRVFALAQGHHLGFMAISVALLGVGAGGTLLALWPPDRRSRWPSGRLLSLAAGGFGLTALAGYLVYRFWAFDMYRIAWEPRQFVLLAVDYLALVLPFTCSGLAVSLALEQTKLSHRVYAANLTGSAAGCLLALALLPGVGGGGTIALCAAAGCAAGWLYARGEPIAVSYARGSVRHLVWSGALWGVGAVVLVVIALLQPDWLEVRLSPYRPLSYTLQQPQARVLSSAWNAFSRVDVVESSAIHIAPGLSLSFPGRMPPEKGVFVDANLQAPIVDADPTEMVEWAAHLPLALAFELAPQGKVLVLEPGGGLDVAVARSLGADHVTAVSSNPLVVQAVERYGDHLYGDGVEAIVRSPRSFARSAAPAQFDLVDVALNDAQHTVASGAYALSEDYVYTLEGFRDYIALLEPDGLLVVHRWLQTPPSESARAWSLMVTALESEGLAPRSSLVALRSWSTMLILAKKGTFQEAELERVRRFAGDRRFDLVYLPDIQPEEVNRYNVYPGAPYYNLFMQLLSAERREALYRSYPYDLRPPSDDRPYYRHLFRWRQVSEIWQALGHTWQPFGGGGYLVLIGLLLVATLAAVVLIVLPLLIRRRIGVGGSPRRVRWLIYFGCLGIAYLGVEIPLIQRIVLLVEQPTFAFVTVVVAMLTFSGLGSLLSRRLPVRFVIPALLLYLLLLIVLLPAISDWALGQSLAWRFVLAFALIAPLGTLMGIPFPAGIARLQELTPSMIPWAWAVNGCTSVFASISAALAALAWGFSSVLCLAAVSYLVAWLTETRAKSRDIV